MLPVVGDDGVDMRELGLDKQGSKPDNIGIALDMRELGLDKQGSTPDNIPGALG